MDDTPPSSSVSPPCRDELRIREEAAQWLEALKTSGPREKSAFAAWLKESPSHVRELLRTTALDRELGRLSAQHGPDIQTILASISSNVIPLHGAVSAAGRTAVLSTERRRRKVWRWVAGLAAAVAVVSAGLVWLRVPGLWGGDNYTTALGEQRTFHLQDGSVVYLNTNSHLDVRFSASSRDIWIRGEAMFNVQQDAVRPFRVHTPDATVQALGTQFNVRHEKATGTQVAVLEGRVQVSEDRKLFPSIGSGDTGKPATAIPAPTKLVAGEEARIVPDGPVVKRSGVDLVRVAAWRQRRLVFRLDSFTDIAAEFNRYNEAPKLYAQGDAIVTRRFNGVFDADDPESFAAVLAQDATLVVESSAEKIVIRSRDDVPTM